MKKERLPGVIFKYMKKIQFQYSTFDTPFIKERQLCKFWENGELIFRSGKL